MSSRPSLDLPTPSRSFRPPAPALFVGPPSLNDSTTSLSNPQAPRPGLLRSRSHLSERPITPVLTRQHTQTQGAFMPPGPAEEEQQQQQPPLPQTRPKPKTGPTQSQVEATWSEMQSTLSEVELSAFSATRVFGQKHADALSRLREAQIGLARSWGRGEDDESSAANDDKGKTGNGDKATPDISPKNTAPESNTGNNPSKPSTTTNSDNISANPIPAPSETLELPGDGQADILLARQRREANDRYFERVNRGVLDVVGRLEEVARAMKGVERESKELWGEDNESLRTAGG